MYTARVKDNQKERITREKNTDANHTLPRLESDVAIRDRIFTIRDVQVILDRDLAELYGVPTGTLNQAVKRNKNRFPEHFMFQLSVDEFRKWKSQIVISNLQETTVRMGLRKRPFAFTEHGVAMLASVLRSETAVRVSIGIIDAFIAMRRFLLANGEVFKRIENVERRQIADQVKNDERFGRIFAEPGKLDSPVRGVFYDGQLWDARALVLKLIARTRRSIFLIDNWATPEVLDPFARKRDGVKVTIFTSEHYNRDGVPDHKISVADVKTFNAQYHRLSVRYNELFHDRFLIIDDKELYLIGASLKDFATAILKTIGCCSTSTRQAENSYLRFPTLAHMPTCSDSPCVRNGQDARCPSEPPRWRLSQSGQECRPRYSPSTSFVEVSAVAVAGSMAAAIIAICFISSFPPSDSKWKFESTMESFDRL